MFPPVSLDVSAAIKTLVLVLDLLGTFVFALFAGLFVGTIAFGWVADAYGRRFVFTFSLLWYSAATLFMLFAGILFGVFLTAMVDLLGRVIGGGQTLRLVIVCVLFTGLLSGVAVLGGATIAQQVTALSSTIRSQLGNAKDFLEKRGIDTSFLNLGTTKAAVTDATTPAPATKPASSRS